MEALAVLKSAMPFQPVMGLGTCYCIPVPERISGVAMHADLSELPIDITDDPDLVYFTSSKMEKNGWKVCGWVIRSIPAIALSSNILQNLR